MRDDARLALEAALAAVAEGARVLRLALEKVLEAEGLRLFRSERDVEGDRLLRARARAFERELVLVGAELGALEDEARRLLLDEDGAEGDVHLEHALGLDDELLRQGHLPVPARARERHLLVERVLDGDGGERSLPHGALEMQRAHHARRPRREGDVVKEVLLRVLVQEGHLGARPALLEGVEVELVLALRERRDVDVLLPLEHRALLRLLERDGRLEALRALEPVLHREHLGVRQLGRHLALHLAARERLARRPFEPVEQRRAVGDREEDGALVRALVRARHRRRVEGDEVLRRLARRHVEELGPAPKVVLDDGLELPVRGGGRIGDGDFLRDALAHRRREGDGVRLRLLRHAAPREREELLLAAVDAAPEPLDADVGVEAHGMEGDVQLDVVPGRDEALRREDAEVGRKGGGVPAELGPDVARVLELQPFHDTAPLHYRAEREALARELHLRAGARALDLRERALHAANLHQELLREGARALLGAEVERERSRLARAQEELRARERRDAVARQHPARRRDGHHRRELGAVRHAHLLGDALPDAQRAKVDGLVRVGELHLERRPLARHRHVDAVQPVHLERDGRGVRRRLARPERQRDGLRLAALEHGRRARHLQEGRVLEEHVVRNVAVVVVGHAQRRRRRRHPLVEDVLRPEVVREEAEVELRPMPDAREEQVVAVPVHDGARHLVVVERLRRGRIVSQLANEALPLADGARHRLDGDAAVVAAVEHKVVVGRPRVDKRELLDALLVHEHLPKVHHVGRARRKLERPPARVLHLERVVDRVPLALDVQRQLRRLLAHVAHDVEVERVLEVGREGERDGQPAVRAHRSARRLER
mmetsp:Transcript_3055/g.11079  ORF Transcript_3055/g.11079 Transcript_3055/m.11079 type:complete len:836 (+) Transcript_3055:502-3009(+)